MEEVASVDDRPALVAALAFRVSCSLVEEDHLVASEEDPLEEPCLVVVD